MSNTNVAVKLSQIVANPYRDLNLFPINQATVEGLMESIKDTDFWDNLVIRVKNNTLSDGTVIKNSAELIALFDSGYDFIKEKFELCYGHHRVAALKTLDWAEINIPVKWVDDENMLKMMALENKDSGLNQIAVKLETYRQVKASITKTLKSYKNFTEYKKDGGKLYTNKQGFENALSNGVGFKTVKKFLGETWSETDIRYSANVVSYIEAGFFLQEDIIDVPSIGLLQAMGSIAEFLFNGDAKKELQAPDWPAYFKTAAIAAIIDRCKVDAKGWQKVTVAQLRRAKSLMVNDGVNPASFIKSGNVKNAFDIVKATKELVYDKDKDEETNIAAVEALRELDGFSDYHDLDELIKRVTESAIKSLARGEGSEEHLDVVDSDDLEKQIANADAEISVPDMFAAEIDNEGEEIVQPIIHLIAAYNQTVTHVKTGTDALLARADEIGEDDKLDEAAVELLSVTAGLVFNRLGKEALIEIFNLATGE